MHRESVVRMVVVGGGPAGNAAATVAATLGAEVTLVEDAIVGGAAHLWDCIPSKAMVASSTRMAAIRMASEVGFSDAGHVGLDMRRLTDHLDSITGTLAQGATDMLTSQGVELVKGRGRFLDAHTVEADTEHGAVRIPFDVALVSTGSRPWVPDWAPVDGERILTTRHAYHLPELPEHLVIVGSGVTGVEMTDDGGCCRGMLDVGARQTAHCFATSWAPLAPSCWARLPGIPLQVTVVADRSGNEHQPGPPPRLANRRR